MNSKNNEALFLTSKNTGSTFDPLFLASKNNNNIYKGVIPMNLMAKNTTKMLALIFGLVLGLVLMTAFASAASTLVSPVVNNNYSTSLLLSCTTDTADTMNATFYYNATGGRAVTELTHVHNTSASQIGFNTTASILSLTDAITYNFTCMTVEIGAAAEYSAVVRPVTIDNTDPVCTSKVQKPIITVMDPNTLECSCPDGIDTVPTTTRVLTKPDGRTVTITSSSYVSSDSNQLGKYTFACSAVDDAGNSDSDDKTYVADTEEDATGSLITAKTAIKSNLAYYALGGLALVIICAVAIYFLSGKK